MSNHEEMKYALINLVDLRMTTDFLDKEYDYEDLDNLNELELESLYKKYNSKGIKGAEYTLLIFKYIIKDLIYTLLFS